MNIRSGNNDSGVAGDTEGILLLLQQILSRMLLKIRSNEDLYEFYTKVKDECSAYGRDDSRCVINADAVFKVLMSYPQELLDIVILPSILRYFEWSAESSSSADAKGCSSIVTPDRCYYFLKDDTNGFQHSAEMCQSVFDAVKVLQRLQMVIFGEKPMLHDINDPDSESPTWSSLETSGTLEFIQSLPKGRNTATGGTDSGESSREQAKFQRYPELACKEQGLKAQENEQPEQRREIQSDEPELVRQPSQRFSPGTAVNLRIAQHQKRKQKLPPPPPPQSHSSAPPVIQQITKSKEATATYQNQLQPLHQTVDTLNPADPPMYAFQSYGYDPNSLLEQALPDIKQRLHDLTVENNNLRQQDSLLMQQIQCLKQLVGSLQKTVAALSNATSLLTKGKVAKMKHTVNAPSMRSNLIKQSASGTSALSMGTQLSYSDASSTTTANEELVDPIIDEYEPFIIKNGRRPSMHSYTGSQLPPNTTNCSHSMLHFQGDTMFDPQREKVNPMPPYQPIDVPDHQQSSYPLVAASAFPYNARQNIALQSQQSAYKSKKPRPRYKDSQGTRLSRGARYQPPLTADGKHYLLDEEGKFAIVMSNDQDSIYSIYNEFYQSLKPQVDSFVQDFGKSKLVQFRKKRTFQKKKAFVYLIEKISYFTKLPPEYVLQIVDNVRIKEEKSVVWVCNNLGSLKYAIVKYRPDLRQIIATDAD
ncbi:HHR141Cp [Eremothecium sinecaudum]|uniref:HHR141Cp n=1 Tax=Eremothecium sinecaudum TaxID=45286 RepID=A0A0X8HWW0_9SACH|nr:HHR141Cp [Eremothecium sinecaudum]AMD22910.1 HHR141Cp [Eremothecium sinecaudum]